MCGIFGYIGEKDPLEICLEGLKTLEYRGYDSAGIAGIKSNKSLYFIKKQGKISNLKSVLNEKKEKLDIVIGHTRWATHGPPNEVNAHPHIDTEDSLAIVHNGIIENFNELKEILLKKNIKIKSETDTEIVAHLIAHNYKKDFQKAVYKTLQMLKGSYAIAAIHKNHPDTMIVASKESPIAIGFNKKEKIISSDPNAFLGKNLDIIYLKNDEMGIITKSDISIFDKNGKKISKKIEKLDGEWQAPDKGFFKHFMLKEIFEQPLTIQKAMLGNISFEYGKADFSNFNFTNQELKSKKHILIIGCGTSWHAGNVAREMLEELARIPTQCEIASEIRFKNPIITDETLVIAISQSGETADTLLAMREAKAKGAKILGICNVKNSTLSREADSCIFLNAGPEVSVCSTKAFTSQVTILSLFTLLMARQRDLSKEQGKLFLDELSKIPAIVKSILEKSDKIKELSIKYSKYKDFIFLGKRYMYFAALEAALKLKEISYLNASAYPAGELKHGPLALITDKLPVIAFLGNHQTYEKALSNLMEVKARKAPILAIAFEDAKDIENVADDVFYIPKTIDELSIFPITIFGQLFAYFLADEIGKEIDLPRNLAKSVTVE